MSLSAIRAALETAIGAIQPPILVAWENVDFNPTPGVPYQAIFLLPAQPDNSEIGGGFSEQGILQANLFYPVGAGPAAATARAELIRSALPRGTAVTSGGVTVTVQKTPEIGPARAEDDRFMVPVRIRFTAFIGG